MSDPKAAPPHVAASNSQAMGNAPVNPPLTDAGSRIASQINKATQRALNNYNSMLAIVEDYGKPIDPSPSGAPRPVVNPWINLGVQTGALSERHRLLDASDLSINTAVVRSKMRALAIEDEATGIGGVTDQMNQGLAAPITSATFQAALEHASSTS